MWLFPVVSQCGFNKTKLFQRFRVTKSIFLFFAQAVYPQVEAQPPNEKAEQHRHSNLNLSSFWDTYTILEEVKAA